MERETSKDMKCGLAVQITLPSGKFFYVGEKAPIIEKVTYLGYKTKLVNYYGHCCSLTINDRVHNDFFVMIDGVDADLNIDRIATPQECDQALIKIVNDSKIAQEVALAKETKPRWWIKGLKHKQK